MLGEGLTTAAPVQRLTFDESVFDRPQHPVRRRLTLALALVAVLVAAAALL